jgi:large subunit ribosomal protein L13
VITNTDQLKVTGNKENDKMYFRYSGYPGGLRQRTLGEQRKLDSRKIVEASVYGMLPKNSLRDQMIRNLKLFKGKEHTHKAQLSNK